MYSPEVELSSFRNKIPIGIIKSILVLILNTLDPGETTQSGSFTSTKFFPSVCRLLTLLQEVFVILSYKLSIAFVLKNEFFGQLLDLLSDSHRAHKQRALAVNS